MFFEKIGNENSNIRLIWLHGWGVDHNTLLPLAKLFPKYENYLLDLAGFGKSQEPQTAWGTEEYANSVENFINELPTKTTIVIGHSFGGRICIKLASKNLKNINGIVLIGGAGLPYRRGFVFKSYIWFAKIFFPIIKKIFPFVKKIKIGSSDYKKSSLIMKEVFKKTIADNFSEISKNIKIPTLLIYGEKDTAAPVYFGEIYNKNIENSKLLIVSGANHYSLLLENNKQVQYFINNFIKEDYNRPPV